MKYVEIEGIDASTYAGKAAKALKIKVRGILFAFLLQALPPNSARNSMIV